MGKKVRQDYYLGLDIGTESVGWAVTDENYNILKFNGKNMWGSRLFDEANTAAARRQFRTNRRRLQRRSWRIALLQELFAKEINKVDENFFRKLKESPLVVDDRSDDHIYTLFQDAGYTDVEFYKEYPTIYHLRKALLTENRKFDVRLVYLALHHMMKHRGHFLYTGTVENATAFSTAFAELKNMLKDEFEIELSCNSETELANLLKDKHYTKKDKNTKAMELLNCDKKNKQLKAIIGLLCGSKCKLTEIFADDSLEECSKPSISFSENSYEDLRAELENELGERCGVLDIIKGVYDWAVLADILAGGEINGVSYLSVAKVAQYEKHKKDLQVLKKVLKADKKEYNVFFQKAEKDNYAAYIGYTKIGGKKITVKRCAKEDFFKRVKKSVEKIPVTEKNDKDVTYILEEIQNDNFLPLQVSKSNSVIPYQVNEMEVKAILNNAVKYLQFLNEKDAAGITVAEKIDKTFIFRIPYYVGPLNTKNGTNAWMERKATGRITPWNFNEKVDLDASAEKFIRRMTNKCTYLYEEDVMPKHSLLYEEFAVLNELNNVKIGADKLSVELKQKIFKELFEKKKTVTKKMLEEYLRCEGIALDGREISGMDIKFNSSLSSYMTFHKILGERIRKYSVQQMIEKIILWITLYGEETKMLKRVIRRHYDRDMLSDIELNKICRVRYQGWGKLSQKLLNGIAGVLKETGESYTIIQALRETQDNFRQVLSDRYTFSEQIDKLNQKDIQEITSISYDTLVKNLPASPSVKRAIWQVILITEEIYKIMGKNPRKIFVEVARGNKGGVKKRTTSRKDWLLELYNSCKNEVEDELLESLQEQEESNLRSIKLFLYYTQLGKCMYSGEPIDISKISNAKIYDRDHIYPQSKVKDDSIDNLILVKSELNREKSDRLISADIQKNMKTFWGYLRKKGFITDKKYQRLMRKEPFTDEELAGFINRQLVEARQSSKLVINLFKQIYAESTIVYVKAHLASDFRKEQLKTVKARSLNDYHHAQDAYLNIVVGNVYYERYTNNPMQWLKNSENKKYNLKKTFDFDVIKGNKIIWKKGKCGTLATVEKNYQKRDVQYTRQVTVNKGGLFNQMLVSKQDNASIPVKEGMDVNIYGGYKKVTPAYFVFLESDGKKGVRKRSMEAVPLYMQKEYEKNPQACIPFFEQEYGLENVKIILPKICKNAYMVIDGFPMNLRGTTGVQLQFQGAVQLMLPQESVKYLKKIENYIKKNTERTDKRNLLPVTKWMEITTVENIALYDVLCKKLKDTIYQYRPANPYKSLIEWREKFGKIRVEEQCIVLNEFLHLFQCKPLLADFTLLGGLKSVGTMKKSKVLSSAQSAVLVNQSVTGLFEQEVNLLTI